LLRIAASCEATCVICDDAKDAKQPTMRWLHVYVSWVPLLRIEPTSSWVPHPHATTHLATTYLVQIQHHVTSTTS
jgi:hypothetical protein